VAAAGLLVNLWVLRLLHGHTHAIHVRGAFWHVVGDLLGSLAAIVAGLGIVWGRWLWLDPLVSLFVVGVLAWGGWMLVRESTAELMEAVPKGFSPSQIAAALVAVPGVRGVHHLHIWRVPSGEVAASLHLEIERMQDWAEVLAEVHRKLCALGITHATVQPEPGPCPEAEACEGAASSESTCQKPPSADGR
ncbi:MAG: cation transporter, partial [Zetaproteobacteria bacterium]